jgi:hypothetical protein
VCSFIVFLYIYIYIYVYYTLSGDNSLILIASTDRTVQLWTLAGELTAVLTRGKKWDKIMHPYWNKPIGTYISKNTYIYKCIFIFFK